ncbi:MAG: tyrosine--tRNA ligase [Armatimonadetes bacterium]|nr:tyrosine--tRNA ligase [Armatimonadota bacterium]
MSPEKQLELIRENTVDLIPEDEMVAKLRSGRPLRVKLGVDPTGPDIHLGHTVVLRKLKVFQDLGHTAVLIIGDFTGLIGDPSGRNEGRPQLTREQVRRNAATYREQAFKILNPKKTEFHFNSEWLAKLSPSRIIRLAATHTVNQLLAREDFRMRYTDNQPISLHEFLYPIFQGYDSVAIRADVELGGTEQKFNLLVGRELQSAQSRELTRFAYEGPTTRRWQRLLHGGAAAVTLGEWLSAWSPQSALGGFWAQHSAEFRMIARDRATAPSVRLEASTMDGLASAVRADDAFGFQADLDARGKAHLMGLPEPIARREIPEFIHPQCIITFPILVGTDGTRRMGKSLGNYVGVDEAPDDMFGKVMSIPDEVIVTYFELCTNVPAEDVARMAAEMKSGALNPRDAKRRLAREVVTLYHSGEAAAQADETFLSVFSTSREQTREDYEAVAEDIAIPASLQGKPVWISTALAELGLASSKGDARRLVQGGGVYVDERRVSDAREEVELKPGMLLRVGKRRVARLAGG